MKRFINFYNSDNTLIITEVFKCEYLPCINNTINYKERIYTVKDVNFDYDNDCIIITCKL
jgi:hypothetical protein